MSDILFEVRDGVARFTLHNPEAMNALHARDWPRLGDMLIEVENNPDIRCVLITGSGDNFCAGGNVKEFGTTLGMTTQERATHWMRTAQATSGLLLTMERMPQPVVVSARGVAAGGGLSLVAAADLAIISENCRLICAQIKIGAIPDSGLTFSLVQSVGLKRAKQIGLLGDTFDAKTALDLGLVNWVVPDKDLETRTEELVARLAKGPAVAMGRTKAAANMAYRISFAEYFVKEVEDVGACVSDKEYMQRVQRFIDQRKK